MEKALKQLKRFYERWHPILLSSAAVCLTSFLDYKSIIPIDQTALFEGMLGFQGILVGFLATAKSIIFSVESRPFIQEMKKTVVYKKLINYFMDAINASFISACLSIICLVVNFDIFKPWHFVLISFWVFFSTLSLLSSYRVISKFSKILKA